MCGISGLLTQTAVDLEGLAVAMSDSMDHRGPDDQGVWSDRDAGIALSHRRLSIIDCSPAGHQPMASASGRFVISYNGEIYNFADIAKDLHAAGHSVKGGSDTAVLLEACAAWGVEATLERCIGMFAFALWDRDTRTLTLARDRLGIKPLYWAHVDGTYLFASELKALRATKLVDERIDRDALAGYLRHAYVPAPQTIFKDVFKLPPGHTLTVRADDEAELRPYWDLRAIARHGFNTPFSGTYDEALTELERHLSDAVAKRMVADVPLGAFLSGGVDSSTVVALMQAASSRPVKSFSIGFHDKTFDESAHAKAVADHLGTDHTELFVTPQDALDAVVELPRWYDEPFADSSQIPTLLLSRLTRQHVTVALSGDGGDEVFAGYNRHFWASRIWNNAERIPGFARTMAAGLITAVPPSAWDSLAKAVPVSGIPPQLGDKLHKVANILGADDIDGVYRRLVSQWQDPSSALLNAHERQGVLWDETTAHDRPDAIGRMQMLDMLTYLPDDILTKVDRASMAASLEARVPLLDHRVVEFAWTLPRDFMVRDGRGKAILRDVLYRHVPRELIERPKMGFGVPLADWLRGDLREWAEDLLSAERLNADGYFNVAVVRNLWADHLSGKRNAQHALWAVLMFQAWRVSKP
ncbi:asparagine synthase (glutamine-hydrolyzing) [Magnetovibrio sp.]|uniref:asparagine synthase (glutamine-hydrolyzing) n=1 Tax=Magnetovibrio sp. TaxID=2024836 RepID=UPI002F929C5B